MQTGGFLPAREDDEAKACPVQLLEMPDDESAAEEVPFILKHQTMDRSRASRCMTMANWMLGRCG
jgi:hypothetical protein